MVLFNSLYYKENYLPKRQAAIILGIIKVPESFKTFKLFKNKDFPKQLTEEALKVVKTLNKLIKSSKPSRYQKLSRTYYVQRLKIRQKKIINKISNNNPVEPEEDPIEIKKEMSKPI